MIWVTNPAGAEPVLESKTRLIWKFDPGEDVRTD
jgi:hypothetical protein